MSSEHRRHGRVTVRTYVRSSDEDAGKSERRVHKRNNVHKQVGQLMVYIQALSK
ncbi:hypothetical protein LguiA_016473 [Lonicera macranthoides]